MSLLSKAFFTIFLIVSSFSFIHAQDQSTVNNSWELGAEIQVYPTGIIPGLRFEKFLDHNTSLNFRLGYQLIDHRDLGKHDNEEGTGYGGSIAYRHFFSNTDQGFSLAFRTDLWFNKIDWEQDTDIGTTDITVIQPTLMAEYVYKASEKFVITPSLTFGWEWNASTEGEPTGEGAILLLGCTFGLRK